MFRIILLVLVFLMVVPVVAQPAPDVQVIDRHACDELSEVEITWQVFQPQTVIIVEQPGWIVREIRYPANPVEVLVVQAWLNTPITINIDGVVTVWHDSQCTGYEMPVPVTPPFRGDYQPVSETHSFTFSIFGIQWQAFKQTHE